MNEQILVFPADLMIQLGPQNINRSPFDIINDLTNILEHSSFVDRGPAEENPSLKQIIPYHVIRKGGSVFAYQRTKKGQEPRLHDKWSIGIGGHINPVDHLLTNSKLAMYMKAGQRELEEEIALSGDFKNDIVGFLYDDSDAVGRVHFGVVHRISPQKDKEIFLQEDCLTNGQWMPYIQLKEKIGDFENWSQIVIQNLL